MSDKQRKRMYGEYLNDDRNNELLIHGRGYGGLEFNDWLRRERRILKKINK